MLFRLYRIRSPASISVTRNSVTCLLCPLRRREFWRLRFLNTTTFASRVCSSTAQVTVAFCTVGRPTTVARSLPTSKTSSMTKSAPTWTSSFSATITSSFVILYCVPPRRTIAKRSPLVVGAGVSGSRCRTFRRSGGGGARSGACVARRRRSAARPRVQRRGVLLQSCYLGLRASKRSSERAQTRAMGRLLTNDVAAMAWALLAELRRESSPAELAFSKTLARPCCSRSAHGLYGLCARMNGAVSAQHRLSTSLTHDCLAI